MKYVYLVKAKSLTKENDTFLSSIVSSEAKAKFEVEFWNEIQSKLPTQERIYYYIKEPVY